MAWFSVKTKGKEGKTSKKRNKSDAKGLVGIGPRGGKGTKGQNILFCTFLGLSPACTQNRGAEGSRAKTCRQKRKKGSVKKVVAQGCRGNEEGPAPRNPGRNTLPKASNE